MGFSELIVLGERVSARCLLLVLVDRNTFETLSLFSSCEMMEKVWSELRRIEDEAASIRSEAQSMSKEIIQVGAEEAEKLVANSKIYADEDARKLRESSVKLANAQRDSLLKTNEEAIARLQRSAKKHMKEAITTIVGCVLGNMR